MNAALSVQFHTSERTRKRALLPGLFALLLYGAVWGSLCSMGYLAAQGLLPLSIGAAAAAAGAVLPKRGRLILFPACLAAAAVLTLVQLRQVLSGCALLLNRLFAASEAQNPYRYEMFAVGGVGLDAIASALLPLGLVTAPLFALSGANRLIGCSLCAALLLFMAYLGVTPATAWLILLALAALLPFFSGFGSGIRKLALLFTAILLTILVLFVFSGKDAKLHAWSETTRDTLSAQTMAYGTVQEAQPETEARSSPGKPASPEAPVQAVPLDPHTLTVVLAIAVTLLLLFVPAILSDRLRKRRALLRAGLDDPEHAACIRASFLYAFRWLRLAGLPAENLPYSRQAEAVAAHFPELEASYRAAVPLWQAAAYGGALCTEQQRQQMQAFLSEAKTASYRQMTLTRRIRSKLL